MAKQCIYLVIQTYFMQIFLPFMIWEKIYRFLCTSEIFVDPTHNANYKGKQDFEKIQRLKTIKLNLRANDTILTISRAICCTLTLRSHVRKPLCRNNVNIPLANYVIK